MQGFPVHHQLPELAHTCLNICRVHHEKLWVDEPQAEIKIAGRKVNHLRYEDNIILMAESEEELKSLLMKVK